MPPTQGQAVQEQPKTEPDNQNEAIDRALGIARQRLRDRQDPKNRKKPLYKSDGNSWTLKYF
jgi:hypothetical protein